MSSSIMPPVTTPLDAQPDALVAKLPVRPLGAQDVQGAGQNNKKFDQAMQDYEGVFLSQMVSHMYAGVEVDPMFGGGIGEETMRSLLINEYGKQMAANGGIGLASAMKKQLIALQEQAAAKQLPTANGAAVPAANNISAATTAVQPTNTDSNQ